RIGVRADSSRARTATQRAQTAAHPLLLAGQALHKGLLDRDEAIAANQHAALLREVERHDRNVFKMDVMPHVELGPVGEREDADAFSGADARVVEIPELRALRFGLPLAGAIAEREDALLG